MIVFQTVRCDLAFFGISATHSWANSKSPFNQKNLTALSIFGLFLLLNSVHVTRAETYEEYINCVYTVTALSGTVLCFLTLVWQASEWFAYIDSVESVFNKSEHSNSMAFKLQMNRHGNCGFTFRIEKCVIENNLQKCQSTSGKVGTSGKTDGGQNCTAIHNVAKIYFEHAGVLHNRRRGCVDIATANVVSFPQNVLPPAIPIVIVFIFTPAGSLLTWKISPAISLPVSSSTQWSRMYSFSSHALYRWRSEVLYWSCV